MKRNRAKTIVVMAGAALLFSLVLKSGRNAGAAEGTVDGSAPVPPRSESVIAPTPRAFDQQSAQSLSHFFDSLSQHQSFNGVALFSKDGAQWSYVHGLKNLDQPDSLQLFDRFQLASVSKPFTAFAVLMLIDQGKLSPEDPVDQFIEGFPFPEVKIQHLLTHTSGLGYYAYLTDSLWGFPDCFMLNDDLESMMCCGQIPPYFAAGRGFDYCNTNYALLATIVERVSGTPFQDYMRKKIFEPLGMFDSEIIRARLRSPLDYPVLGHFPNGDNKLPSYLDGVVGDKGMYSTVHDLLKFYGEIKHPTLLPDSLITAATSPKTSTGSNAFYGYGWRISTDPALAGDTIVFHNGWWRGFRTYLWISMQEDKAAIVLTNTLRGGYLKQERIWAMF